MEPERKIEKLLRAYAKKRRAEAGDSLKLHPATRRLLQGEAARRGPRPGKAGTPGFFLAVFWRRLVFALCVVATAFIGVSLFRPAWNPAKKGAPSVSAMNNLRQTGTATKPYAGDNKHVLSASLDELTNQKSAEFVLAEKVAPKRSQKQLPVHRWPRRRFRPRWRLPATLRNQIRSAALRNPWPRPGPPPLNKICIATCRWPPPPRP